MTPARWFIRLWGVAALTHAYSEGLGGDWLLLGSAAAAIAAPSGATLGLLAVAELVNAAVAAPFLSNHWMLAAIVNLGLLAALVATRRRSGSVTGWGDEAVRLATPMVRAAVIAFYAMVVLHKLNWSFLDPARSCAAGFFAVRGASLVPAWLPAGELAIGGTLAAEAGIPLLLAFSRTRAAGIAVAVVFHGILAANPISAFYRFTAVVLALMVLFLPAGAGRAARGVSRPRGAGWLAFVPVLIVLNGLSPYLGLKTESSFGMFSNLRTEAGVTNHLFVPAGLQWFGYQRDLVAIAEPAAEGALAIRVPGLVVPFFEVARDPGVDVAYARAGAGWQAVADDPAFVRPSWLERKLIAFRPIDPGVEQWCRH